MYIIPSLEKLEKRTLLYKYFCDEQGLYPHSGIHWITEMHAPLLCSLNLVPVIFCNRAIIEILLCLMISRIAQAWFIKCNFNFDDCHLKGELILRVLFDNFTLILILIYSDKYLCNRILFVGIVFRILSFLFKYLFPKYLIYYSLNSKFFMV